MNDYGVTRKELPDALIKGEVDVISVWEPYANKATVVGLKWLREIFDLNDEEMDVIESQFNDRVGNIAKIEDSARQVNRKANQRKRGFFKRIFGS